MQNEPKHETATGIMMQEAQAEATLEFTDRYKMMGIPYPDPATMCSGQCDGVGRYPVRDTDTSNTKYESEQWLVECRKAGGHMCDGYHFIQCAECDGTGKARVGV